MKSNLKIDQNSKLGNLETYEKIMTLNNQQGLSSYVFCMREFNPVQTKNLIDKHAYYNRKIVDQQISMLDLAREMETDLRLVGIIGLKSAIRQGVPDLIDSLQKSGVKTHILTGDTFENVFMTASNLNI